MARTDEPVRARGRFDDLVYEPDPLGRVGKGRWVRRDDPRAPVADNPDAAVARLRAAWRNGELDAADPDDLSKLDDSVGPRGSNNKLDVAKVETLLAAADAFDLEPTDGPTGNFSDRRADAIRDFQHANGLKPDGLIEPGGETLDKLQFVMGAARNGHSKGVAANPPVGLRTDSRPATATAAAKSRKERVDEINRRNREQTRELTRPTREGTRAFQRSDLTEDRGPVPVSSLERRRRRLLRPDARAEIKRVTDHRNGEPPTVNMEEARQWTILNNRPARFEIKRNPKERGTAPFQRDNEIGMRTVAFHDRTIEREAKARGVDPNLIRAIMFVENADGNPSGSNKFLERIGAPSSILPMNIKPRIWSGMGGVRGSEFQEPEKNIRAAVSLVKAIQDRLPQRNRTPEMIGSIWNFSGAEQVNEIGARIQKAFDNKLWNQNRQ